MLPPPVKVDLYFNPRSPRGERPLLLVNGILSDVISIHAPREGSDAGVLPPPVKVDLYFNPRSPRGERHKQRPDMPVVDNNFNPRSPRGERLYQLSSTEDEPQFQSTLPARGATRGRSRRSIFYFYFNPRSPRGERLISCSIHIPEN